MAESIKYVWEYSYTFGVKSVVMCGKIEKTLVSAISHTQELY